jgi:hypothetical protein
MSNTRTITAVERAPFASSQVNREAGYIDGVLICGVQSRNGRDYPPAVLTRDFAKYESAPVNADHGDESTVGRRLGWFSDVKPGADGRPRGRLNLLKSHPLAEAVFEAAERNPSLFGMSHVAVCGTKRVNGRETVESINKVLSIDLVADPATTKSLYESFNPTSAPMKFKAFAEAVGAKFPTASTGLMKFLREEMGEMEMPEAPDMASAVEPSDPVKAAFSQAMHALIDQFDSGGVDGPGLLSKLKQLMKAAEKMSGAEPAGEPPAEMESIRKQLADALKENAELVLGGMTLTEVQRKAFDAMTTTADRKALVESFRVVSEGQKPKSGEQNPPTRESSKPTAVPTDGAKFAEFIR